jgi:hypothetical protein
MSLEAGKAQPGRWARVRERHADRRQRRAWRRERRKGVITSDAARQAESDNLRGGFFKKD